MDNQLLLLGDLILPDRLVPAGALLVGDGRIQRLGPAADVTTGVDPATPRIDAAGGFLAPGYIDLHVHGGAGADFMDGTREAFQTVLEAHLRHGTTSIVPTTTVARHERMLRVLQLCREFRRAAESSRHTPSAVRSQGDITQSGADGTRSVPAALTPRVLGAHFYGPYFNREACGCHPADAVRPPDPAEYAEYLDYADSLVTATVAPELPGAEAFVRACCDRGIRTNVGHSQATFSQMAEAVGWGVRHVDHLYCAMSDKTKLRQVQPYPMQGGVLEATLFFDELTTEVIADGKHLSADLLLLALKIKGPDRLALVTDCNRALDMPEGRYTFGPLDEGEPFDHRDGVGVMPDGKALASSTQGLDHMVRTFHQLTGRPLWEVVRMASLTPARIAGWDCQIGSLEVGKRADVLVLDRQLHVQHVVVDGASNLHDVSSRNTAAGR
jgi:N-acetylglucosamine-6-phosphate deacetylase